MSGEEACVAFSNYLTHFEKEEIKQFEVTYFACMNKKKLYGGSYEQTDEEGQQVFNNGFDNDQNDYMFEISD